MKSAYSLSFFLLLSYSITAQNSGPSIPAESPDTVKVGAYVISVHDINFHEKEYTIRFWLWFVYNNPEFDFPLSWTSPTQNPLNPLK